MGGMQLLLLKIKIISIIGVLNIGFKDVYLSENENALVCYIFGLRVNSKCQAGGVGTELLKAAENYAFQHNVRGIYLSVNGNNAKAKRFFDKNHFECLDLREILLFQPKNVPWESKHFDCLEFTMQDEAKLSKVIESYLPKQFLQPNNIFHEVFKSSGFTTFALVKDKTSNDYGGFALFEINKKNDFRIYKFLHIHRDIWTNRFAQTIGLIFGYLALGWIGYKDFMWEVSLFQTQHHIRGLILLLFNLFLMYALYKIIPLLQLWSGLLFEKKTGRMCNFFISNPQNAKLMEALGKQAMIVGHKDKFSVLILNITKNDAINQYFKQYSSMNFLTDYMFKYFEGPNVKSSRNGVKSVAFCDPRDF